MSKTKQKHSIPTGSILLGTESFGFLDPKHSTETMLSIINCMSSISYDTIDTIITTNSNIIGCKVSNINVVDSDAINYIIPFLVNSNKINKD